MTEALRTGAAARVISPLAEHLAEGVYLGGYGFYDSRRAEGLHDDVFCRALALSDGDTTVLLLALDLVGMSPRRMLEVRGSVAATAGLPLERVLVACTHSHAGPDTQGLWGGVPPAYLAYMRDRCVEAAAAALAELREGHLEAATAAAEGLARNRRGWDHTDTTLTVLRARRPDGATVATLVNFACHPTVTAAENLHVSRDFPAGLVTELERELGGVAVFINGAQGDVIPATGSNFAEAEELGRRLARASVEALGSAQALDGPITLRERRLTLPMEAQRLPRGAHALIALTLPIVRSAAQRGILRRACARLAARGSGEMATALAGISMFADGALASAGLRPVVRTRVSRLDIGAALTGLTAPGEVMTRLAEPLRASLAAPHSLFLGLTNGTLGYFLPSDEWMSVRNGDYEESVSLGPQAGAALAAALRLLIEEV